MISLQECIGTEDNFCSGYMNPGSSGKGYVVAVTLGTGKAPIQMGHDGSITLDKINAFDRAEVDDVHLGQINMITVSSFCGPNGLLLGYHFLRSRRLFERHPLLDRVMDYKDIQIYSAAPLISASRTLFGTTDRQHFPLIPGGHIPCAEKSISAQGPTRVYCAFGIAIPENPMRNACLMMEDVGELPFSASDQELKEHKSHILHALAQSVFCVSENQRVSYKEVFVEVKDTVVGEHEVGCALVAAPYFTLARNVVSQHNPDSLKDMILEDWKQ